MSSELQIEEKLITEEYLLTHGFYQYKNELDGDCSQIPFEGGDSLCFREIEFNRQMCVVIFSPYNGDKENWGYNKMVYFQDDVGCGFVCIPFPWWDLTIDYFESVYYGIRGEKPKLQEKYLSDYEVITPKQIENNQP